MTRKTTSEWLASQNKFNPQRRRAITISITSGKGGVGKTSLSIKLAKAMVERGHRVLLIDCDSNLSNTAIKLGLPIASRFADLMAQRRDFEDCIHRDGNFHLLPACNGDLGLFRDGEGVERLILDVLVAQEKNYDYILLDSPAGVARANLTVNAYTDHRFVVVTPDRSSITDAYSLIKLLELEYGVKENHLLPNCISSQREYLRIVRSMGDTVDRYLTGRLKLLGGVRKENVSPDEFDQLLAKNADFGVHKDISKIVGRFTETDMVTPLASPISMGPTRPGNKEQDVRSI